MYRFRVFVNQTKDMLLTHQQGQNRNINTANRASENAAEFKCLVKTLTNQNSVHEDTKSKLLVPLGNACYHSVQNVLFSASCLFLSSVSNIFSSDKYFESYARVEVPIRE
jgi:hypothetical protein